jgi:hypothetical protein
VNCEKNGKKCGNAPDIAVKLKKVCRLQVPSVVHPPLLLVAYHAGLPEKLTSTLDFIDKMFG